MAPTQTQLKVFGYVRVSTDNQLENYSIDEQIERIKAYCKAKGWILLKIYTDGGFSGGNMNRPALQQMLEALQNVKADAVLVYKLDRLSRSQKDTLAIIEDKFLINNVDFISINENFDTSTPFGRAMIGILSVFAQLEKDQITERFTMGRIGRSKAGYYHGGAYAPMGYDYKDGELIVNEYESIKVREIYALFLDGKSINSIWHDMENKYGGKWSAPKIRIILLNSTYCGKVKFSGVEYEGNHIPIIDADTFKLASKLMFSDERENGKTAPQKTPFRADTLLSGLIRCARCNAKYSGSHGFYKCYSRSKNSKKAITDPNCKNDNWRHSDLENLVVGNIKDIVRNEKMLDQLIVSNDNIKPVADTTAVKKRITDLSAQIEKLIDLYQLGSIPMETLSDRISMLTTEKNVLQQSLDIKKDDTSERISTFKRNAQIFLEKFDTASPETKRILISTRVEIVWVDGQDINIEWRI